MVDKYDNREIGINSRLDTIQAAILLPKFKAFVDYELEAVNEVAQKYTNALCDKVITPVVPKGFFSSWAQYTILLKDRETRNRIQACLKREDVPSMIYYPRGLHQQKAFGYMKLRNEDYSNTIKATNCCLSLPIHPYMTESDQQRVISVLLEEL